MSVALAAAGTPSATLPPAALSNAGTRAGAPPSETRAGAPPLRLPPSLIDQIAVAYLTLPLLLFLAVALVPAISGLATAAAAAALWPFFRKAGPHGLGSLRGAGFVAVIAIGWSILGGSGHLMYANAMDWQVRDAVLDDLARFGWPSVYGLSDGSLAVLRAPVGYYMVPSYLARWTGVSPQLAVGCWTALGAILFLLLATGDRKRAGGMVASAFLIMLAAGADLIGSLIAHRPLSIIQHMQWWSGAFQYSSVTTLMFWVPNHALPAWLGVLLFWRLERSPAFARISGLIIVAAVLWSPFAGLGLLPYALLMIIRHFQTGTWRVGLSWGNLLVTPLTGGIVVLGLTVATGGIPRAVVDSANTGLGALPIFLLINGGPVMLIPICLGWRPGRWGWISIVSLIAIPFYSLGPGNDFCDRTSIPALTVLAVAAARRFYELDWPAALESPLRSFAVSMAVSLFLVSAATPGTEIARAVLLPAWPADQNMNAAVASDFAPHYIVPLPIFEGLHIFRIGNAAMRHG